MTKMATTNPKKAKPVCVILGDIHFTVGTIELASAALAKAQMKAAELGVPLVLNGDTLDSKAVIRGECANRLIDMLSATSGSIRTYVNTGNHDLLSERSSESSLNFLKPFCEVVKHPVFIDELDSWVIPYQTDTAKLKELLSTIPSGSRLIIHQGVQTAFMGHYTVDRTSLPKEEFADFRVIASHYHRAQDIKCGRPRKGAVGLFSYIGNPYSLSFAEANDGPKGIQILYDDGLLELVPTGLRKHVVADRRIDEAFSPIEGLKPNDLLWLKIRGPYSELEKLSKKALGERHLGHGSFRLEKIADEVGDADEAPEKKKRLTGEEVFDSLIDQTTEAEAQKKFLKDLWREVAA
jgi:DNA repair exonuclease SbcCD nuclease subunit